MGTNEGGLPFDGSSPNLPECCVMMGCEGVSLSHWGAPSFAAITRRDLKRGKGPV